MVRTLRSICLQVCIWCLLHPAAWAQVSSAVNESGFQVGHIGVSDGLTQGSVYYILKDSRGFLWFGTQDGLNRYDGHRFRTYRPALGEHGRVLPGSIRGINIFGIVEDPDGNLWIGTEEGLNRYDRQRDQFDCYYATGPDKKPIASRTIPFFASATELLCLSDAEGLVRFDYRKHHKTLLASNLHPTKEYDLQSSTVRTPAGDVWLHAPTGILRYNLNSHRLSHYFSSHPNNLFGRPQVIFSFFIDPDNIVWLGTDSGLIRFDYRRNSYETYATIGKEPISTIFSIAPDRRRRLWLGTQHNGVIYFDKQTRSFGQITDFTNTARQLSDFKISKVYVDNLGIIWANTDPDGLARIMPNAFLFGGMIKRAGADTLPDSRKLSSYAIRGFLEERADRLWILTQNGINVLNPRINRIVERFLTRDPSKSGPAPLAPRCLYRDPQHRIWAGIPGGVMAYKPQSKTFEPVLFASSTTSLVADNYVRAMASIADTLLVAATEDGLYALHLQRLHSQRHQWSKLPMLESQNIFSLSYDTVAKQLWVGTYLNGYYQYQLPGSEPVNANLIKPWKLISSGLKGYTVLNIRPDKSYQTLWLSCDRGLVALMPRTNHFRLYTERHGLANSFVYGSLTDKQNNIWMSTNRGLSRLEMATQTIKNFTPNDGLQGYEFNGNAFLKTTTGDLYFGGVTGFNQCRPNAFRSSSFQPYVHIYSLTVNEEPLSNDMYVGESAGITVSPSQNTLSLEFAALDYTSDGHNSYQYQLTNYDDHWVSAGERNYVRYANLPPGDYTFQVKAANKDGHWSPHIRTLAIHIEPPFWQKWPFVVLMLIVLIAAIWTWIRQRENTIRHQQADRLRLAYDIQEQVKKDIARDIHDEIGTRLATIKLYTTQLTRMAGETPALVSLKTTIFQLINDTIGDVRNLLRKLNPQTLEKHGYVAAVDELFSRITASGIVDARFEYEDQKIPENRLPTDMEVMLYRITQELVSNSLKHANANRIDLRMVWQTDRVTLLYQDNGRGFNYEQMQKKAAGLGISNIESRVGILGGRISWQSQLGQGVQATIDIPIDSTKKSSFPIPRINLPQSN
jgi:signal transduction histidine kinase/ligand-binding sensor domain-containing protein